MSGIGLPYWSKYSPGVPAGIVIVMGLPVIGDIAPVPELLEGFSVGLVVDVLEELELLGELFVLLVLLEDGVEFEELFVGSPVPVPLPEFGELSSGSEVVELLELLDEGGVVVSMGFDVS